MVLNANLIVRKLIPPNADIGRSGLSRVSQNAALRSRQKPGIFLTRRQLANNTHFILNQPVCQLCSASFLFWIPTRDTPALGLPSGDTLIARVGQSERVPGAGNP